MPILLNPQLWMAMIVTLLGVALAMVSVACLRGGNFRTKQDRFLFVGFFAVWALVVFGFAIWLWVTAVPTGR